MYNSVFLSALLVAAGMNGTSAAPSWITAYGQARELGKKAHKPLAVVIGTGKSGWDKLSQDSKLGPEIEGLLAANYVAVYVDAEQAEGKKLAADFNMRSGLGIVISDGSGELQAFHHEGSLSSEALGRYLRRYADPSRVVTSTETNPSTTVSYYPASNPTFSQPFARPAMRFSSGSC
jgi:hypothetical protein